MSGAEGRRSAAGPAAPSRSRRWRRVLVAVVLFLVIYGVVGIVGVPFAASRWIAPAIDGAVAGSLAVGPVTCNPFTFALEIGPTSLRDPSGREVLAFERVRLNFDPVASLFTASWRFAEFTVDRPRLTVAIDEQGETGLLAALRSATPEPEDPDAPPRPLLTRIPRIWIGHGAIVDAMLRFEDRSGPQPFEIEWSGASVDFGRLDSAPVRRSPHRIVATASDGATLEWSGSITSEPFSLRGEIALRGMPLAPLMPYISLATTAEVVGGTLASWIDYEIAPLDAPPTARLTLRDSAIDQLSIMDEETVLVHAPRIRMVGARVDLASRSVVVPSVRLSGATLHLVRDESGQPAILRLFPWAAAEATASAHHSEGPGEADAPAYPIERVAAALVALVRQSTLGWSAVIESVALHDQTLLYTDRSTRRPVETALRELELTAGPIRSDAGYAAPFELHGSMGESGTITMRGVIRPLDTDLQVTIEANRVALAPFAPYLPERPVPDLGATNLAQGGFTGAGRVSSRVEWATGRISVAWDGVAHLDELRVDLADRTEPFMSLGTAETKGTIAAEISPEFGARLDWNGHASLGSFRVDAPLPASPAKSALAGAAAQGRLSLRHSEATGLAADWRGSASLQSLEAAASPQGADPAAIHLAQAEHDGSIAAAVPPHAGDPESRISVSHSGRGGVRSLDLRLGDERRGRIVLAESAEIDGTVNASLASSGRLRVSATSASTITALTLDDRASLPEPILASIGSIRHRGVIDAGLGGSMRPSVRARETTGIDSVAITASLPDLGPIDLSAASIRHEGDAGLLAPHDGAPAVIELRGRAHGEGLRLLAPQCDELSLEVRDWRADEIRIKSEGASAAIELLQVRGARLSASRVLIPPAAPEGDGDPAAGARSEASAVPSTGVTGSTPDAPLGDGTPALPDLALSRIRLEDGSLLVTDPSMTPPVRLSVTRVNAEVDGVATRGVEPARFRVNGLVEESGRFELSGSMLPLELARSTEVRFTLTSLPLKPYDPVSHRFVGYEIDSGRVSVSLPVTVRDAMLEGTLDATLDRFYLGRETPGAEALNLPIKLGLALLRDSEERIAVNIPFRGDLRDPDFDLGPLIWQAIVNLLVRATTAPFTLLGALVNAGDRDLSQVPFEPGSAELTPQALADLDLLAKALSQRPAIRVRAIGMVADPADAEALRLATRTEVDAAALEALAKARAEAVVRALTLGAGLSADRVDAAIAEGPVDGAPRVTFELR